MEIILTQGQVALIDDKDFGLVSRYKWHTINDIRYGLKYARAYKKIDGGFSLVHMHRLIMDAQLGQQVDHKDGNGLDNRRQNLRLCSNSENQQNKRKYKNSSSQYKGVSKRKIGWVSYITVNKQRIYLGYFKDEKEAALTYDEAAGKHFGEFANLNFKDGDGIHESYKT